MQAAISTVSACCQYFVVSDIGPERHDIACISIVKETRCCADGSRHWCSYRKTAQPPLLGE
eukprot:1155441-Pelagomonas_calceolata.AAC.2